MDEETQNNATSENPSEGIQSETVSEIDRAYQVAEMQKRENDRREDLLKREESLQARKIVGGQSEGAGQEVKKVEQTAVEYKNEVLAGLHNGN